MTTNSEPTSEEWDKHSVDLDSGAVEYGAGPPVAYCIDLAFEAPNDGQWLLGSDYFESGLEAIGWTSVAAGTTFLGVTVRDMQFERQTSLTDTVLAFLKVGAKSLGIKVKYINQYPINKWHEPVDE